MEMREDPGKMLSYCINCKDIIEVTDIVLRDGTVFPHGVHVDEDGVLSGNIHSVSPRSVVTGLRVCQPGLHDIPLRHRLPTVHVDENLLRAALDGGACTYLNGPEYVDTMMARDILDLYEDLTEDPATAAIAEREIKTRRASGFTDREIELMNLHGIDPSLPE